jgi:ferredoxin, 2Fe-2S
MPKVRFISASAPTQEVEVAAGRSVMLAATINGVNGIVADCGGALACATCHVYVDAGWSERLPAPDENELALLGGVVAERRPNSRLSCQIIVTEALDGITVQLPDRQV